MRHRSHLWYTQALVSPDFIATFDEDPGRPLGTPRQLIEAASSEYPSRECPRCGKRFQRFIWADLCNFCEYGY